MITTKKLFRSKFSSCLIASLLFFFFGPGHQLIPMPTIQNLIREKRPAMVSFKLPYLNNSSSKINLVLIMCEYRTNIYPNAGNLSAFSQLLHANVLGHEAKKFAHMCI